MRERAVGCRALCRYCTELIELIRGVRVKLGIGRGEIKLVALVVLFVFVFKNVSVFDVLARAATLDELVDAKLISARSRVVLNKRPSVALGTLKAKATELLTLALNRLRAIFERKLPILRELQSESFALCSYLEVELLILLGHAALELPVLRCLVDRRLLGRRVGRLGRCALGLGRVYVGNFLVASDEQERRERDKSKYSDKFLHKFLRFGLFDIRHILTRQNCRNISLFKKISSKIL